MKRIYPDIDKRKEIYENAHLQTFIEVLKVYIMKWEKISDMYENTPRKIINDVYFESE